jgi:hypothetical protein
MYAEIRLALVLLAVALLTDGLANAMEASEKGDFAKVESVLAQERQVEIATAKYVLNPNDPSRSQVLRIRFTVNENGDGYILMVNGVDDAQATTEIVYARLKNALIYDPHHVGVMPRGTARNSQLAEFINNAASTGDGLMLHGQLAKKQTDGTDAIAGSMTVMANVSNAKDERISDRVVIFTTSLSGQTTLDKVVGFDVRYKPEASKMFLDSPRGVTK